MFKRLKNFKTQTACAILGALLSVPLTGAEYLVYVGTYTGPKSKGIYSFKMDPQTGKTTEPVLAGEAPNPTFLELNPERKLLYTVYETGGGRQSGAVAAFSIEPATGKLNKLNQQPSGGAGPCHLSLDKAGRYLLVANYGGGSIACLPVKADGSLGEASAVVQHEGSSVNPRRQERPHAHWIAADFRNQRVLTCDLGLDKVLVYNFESAGGVLQKPPAFLFSTKPGAGPRHLAFHPNNRWVYIVNELDSTLIAGEYDQASGIIKELQTVSILPADFQGTSTAAEVEVHPSGKFVYASNRGHDSIAAFAINPENGRLTFIEHQSTQGRMPRHFAIDPLGRWLLAANQGSDSVVVFTIDTTTGRLLAAGRTLAIGAPVCIKYFVTQ